MGGTATPEHMAVIRAAIPEDTRAPIPLTATATTAVPINRAAEGGFQGSSPGR